MSKLKIESDTNHVQLAANRKSKSAPELFKRISPKFTRKKKSNAVTNVDDKAHIGMPDNYATMKFKEEDVEINPFVSQDEKAVIAKSDMWDYINTKMQMEKIKLYADIDVVIDILVNHMWALSLNTNKINDVELINVKRMMQNAFNKYLHSCQHDVEFTDMASPVSPLMKIALHNPDNIFSAYSMEKFRVSAESTDMLRERLYNQGLYKKNDPVLKGKNFTKELLVNISEWLYAVLMRYATISIQMNANLSAIKHSLEAKCPAIAIDNYVTLESFLATFNALYSRNKDIYCEAEYRDDLGESIKKYIYDVAGEVEHDYTEFVFSMKSSRSDTLFFSDTFTSSLTTQLLGFDIFILDDGHVTGINQGKVSQAVASTFKAMVESEHNWWNDVQARHQSLLQDQPWM